MRLKLPKSMVGLSLDPLFYAEMNNFDVEMLLPALFYLVRTGGRDRASRASGDVLAPMLKCLTENPRIRGFAERGEEGVALLDKWVRTSIVHVSRRGEGARGPEQLTYVRPLSFLCYLPSLPAESSRLRKAHHFLYHLLSNYVERGQHDGARRDFLRVLRDAFGVGLVLDEGAAYGGRYDERTDLDTEILLELRYLEGFEAARASVREPRRTPAPACPRPASIFARDVAAFLMAYKDRMPPTILARFLTALLNFEFFIYSMRLIHATNALVLEEDAPPEFEPAPGQLSPIDLYVDMTQVRGSRSDQLAARCVNRDLEAIESYLRSVLTLRTVHRFADVNKDLKAFTQGKDGGEYIKTLATLAAGPLVQPDARNDIRAILNEWRQRDDEDDEGVLPAEATAITENGDLEDMERLVELLLLPQRKSAIQNITGWYWSTGGLARTDGILKGNQRGRRNWRYAMSDMLLETLVQLSVVHMDVHTNRPRGDVTAPDPIALSDFLRILREKYGILIDTPPSFDRSAEATAAAKENFTALKRRLRQMGLFQDLSDDFNAQFIEPRFRERIEREV